MLSAFKFSLLLNVFCVRYIPFITVVNAVKLKL